MRLKYWAFLIFMALVALTPLAYASPPDPSWIRGLYDGGDGDDVVVLLTSGVGAVEPFPLAGVHPGRTAIARVAQPDEGSLPGSAPSSNRPRAPPAR